MGDTSIRKLTLLALIGFVAILGLLALSGTIGGEATYEGTSRCNDCHDDQVENWETTFHGIDFSEWNYHDEPTNKYTYGMEENDTSGMIGSCAECHVVGYGQTDIGGFDPALPWNDTYNAGDDGENLHLLRIGCENCHGPGSDHTSSKAPADIDSGLYAFSTSCGPDGRGCHGDNRQWGNETLDGYFSSDHYVNEAPSYAQSAGCSRCRSTQGFIAHLEGEAWEEVPAPEDMEVVWRITCLACHDPHPGEGEENSFQLRMEPEDLCAECHQSTSGFGTEHVHHPQQEFRTASVVYTTDPVTWMGEIECVNCHMFQSGRGTEDFKMGHSFAPHMEACMECHSMYETPEDARAAVDHVQHRSRSV
jgi:predicted CXXCH cytochrome family protein